ncbi:uncharacterized protein LOC114271600 [Camellia sinensis]|uniref:uncharacterized protein LOC114271600 n=1 Tax=Camellia sinensis TaxID=4442 RepID=UPI001035997E|nr:uncharacterized protein LOC114271600 [Camellia sinensis]
MKKVEEYCKVEDDALQVKAGRVSSKTASPKIAQPISFVPPQSLEPRQRGKRDKRRDSRRSNDQCSHRTNEQLQVDSRRTRRTNKKYTELTEPINAVMSKIQHLSFFKWPSKMVSPPDTRRRDKRCEYHKDHGHETESCYALKDHLEELVQDGWLQQYIRKGNPTKALALRQDSPPLGVIHMIYSQPAPLTVHTNQSHPVPREQHTPTKQPKKAPSIAFNDSDLVGMTISHIDPLIIRLCVNQFTIERILVDPGSTSKVMYYETLIKLGINESDLSLAPYPLFGFNMNPEYPLGKITLPVRAGSRIVKVEFLVVKLPSLYNVIMGRTWLHIMQAVPSTYHQLMRFPTARGVEEIHGCRQLA